MAHCIHQDDHISWCISCSRIIIYPDAYREPGRQHLLVHVLQQNCPISWCILYTRKRVSPGGQCAAASSHLLVHHMQPHYTETKFSTNGAPRCEDSGHQSEGQASVSVCVCACRRACVLHLCSGDIVCSREVSGRIQGLEHGSRQVAFIQELFDIILRE